MGIHYVNGEYLKDNSIDVDRPEAVMYEPKPDGSLEVIAVNTSPSPALPRSKATCSISSNRRTATASIPSTNCTSGPGDKTLPAPLPT